MKDKHTKEMHKIASRLEMMLQSNERERQWLTEALAYVRTCAGARALESAYDEEKNERNKEAERESSPHTPYKEKGEEKKKERKEVTLAHSSESEAHPLDERVCVRLTVEDLFAKFWQAYPRKVGKIDARRVFERTLRNEATDPVELVDKMRRRIAQQRESDSWQSEDGRFIPYPATWLNAGHWEDEDTINLEPPRRTPEEAAALKARLLAEHEAIMRGEVVLS